MKTLRIFLLSALISLLAGCDSPNVANAKDTAERSHGKEFVVVDSANGVIRAADGQELKFGSELRYQNGQKLYAKFRCGEAVNPGGSCENPTTYLEFEPR